MTDEITPVFTRRIAAICIVLFALAFGLRLLTWQNNQVDMSGVQWMLTHTYRHDAKVLLSGDLNAFLRGPDPPSDANILLHPPGYPIFIAAVFGTFGEGSFLIFQILLNSLAPVLIFLIGWRLFDVSVGVVAGFLGSLAPQFAYHSAVMLPDELSVLPILTAVFFLARAILEKKLLFAVVVGFALGISCWLRPNALLLPVFFAISSLCLLPKQMRIKFALLLITSFVVTISPITIRNYIVFESIIPISLGMGTTFIEGLADYDADGRLGLPNTDEGVMEMDARLANRPDYYGFLLSPDGVQRERTRIRTGLAVVAANPGWYLTSVLHRGISTLRMERVPVMASERDERDTTHPVFYYPNVPLKIIQKVFITAVILPLLIFGVILLLRDKTNRRKLAILATVPLYYMSVQALIHTEYRYVLATPHIVVIIVSVALVSAFAAVPLYVRKSSAFTKD